MARLVVDAMNVIGSRPTGWWRDRRGAERRLIDRLERLADHSGDEIIVVLDRQGPSGVEGRRRGRLRVVYSRREGRNAADDRIVELVAEDASPDTLEVITSDGALSGRVRDLGASVGGPSRLLDRLDALE